jgi:hypothetical protein
MTRILSITAAALAVSGTAFAGDYSTSDNDRPLVLPQGMIQVNGDLSNLTGDIGIGLGVDYGVAEGMALGVDWGGYAMGDAGGVSKEVGVDFGYSVMSDDSMDFAAGIGLPMDFGGDILSSANINGHFRYKLMDGALAISTGDGLIGLGFGDATTLSANVNLDVSYQVADNMALGLGTDIVSIGLVGDGGTTVIGDMIPLRIGFGYNMDDMDFGLNVGADAKNFGDTMNLGLGFAYRM